MTPLDLTCLSIIVNHEHYRCRPREDDILQRWDATIYVTPAPEEQLVVGHMDFYLANYENSHELLMATDAESGDLVAMTHPLLAMGEQWGLKRDLFDEVLEYGLLGGNLLLLDRVAIYEKYRGQELGATAVRELLQMFSNRGIDYAACTPAPTEVYTPVTHEHAVESLTRTWEKAGFRRYKDDLLVCRLNTKLDSNLVNS